MSKFKRRIRFDEFSLNFSFFFVSFCENNKISTYEVRVRALCSSASKHQNVIVELRRRRRRRLIQEQRSDLIKIYKNKK